MNDELKLAIAVLAKGISAVIEILQGTGDTPTKAKDALDALKVLNDSLASNDQVADKALADRFPTPPEAK